MQEFHRWPYSSKKCSMVEHSIMGWQYKKVSFLVLLVFSGLALIGSLGFIQTFSQQSSMLDQISSYGEPKLNLATETGKPPLQHTDITSPVISGYISNGEILRKEEIPSSGNGKSFVGLQGNYGCTPKEAPLRVFVYNMPPEFHFGMLDWAPDGTAGGGVWPTNLTGFPRYPGGLNLQHSVEYWLTIDLLSSNMPGRKSPCTALRVEDAREADVFFVPFFSSVSYNRHSKVDAPGMKSRNEQLQEKLVQYLMGQEAWRRSGGKNHVIVMHHPNSMVTAREQLRSAMYIVADFGRYSPSIGNVDKDIVAPYKHVLPSYAKDTSTFASRNILLFFQGAIFRKDGGYIRQELYSLLKDEKGVHFAFGNAQRDGIRSATEGMRSSKFCLNIAGDTPSSNRLFDAIASHCVPVIISDDIELPYEDVLDYTEFCIFVQAADALKKGFLINLLSGVKDTEWTRMWQKLIEISHHFEYQYPSQPDDAVSMIWKAIARKLPAVRLSLHKGKRYSRAWLLKQGNSSFNVKKFSKVRRKSP